MKSIASFFIILFVTILVAGTAVSLMTHAVADKNANWRMVRQLWPQQELQLNRETANAPQQDVIVSGDRAETLSKPSDSVYDFLKAAGADPSFANRVILAQHARIYNYTGSSRQNLELLDFLKTANGIALLKQ